MSRRDGSQVPDSAAEERRNPELPCVPGRIEGMIAGVDEVGRGPLAGAVVAAAVILPAGREIPGVGDSKALTSGQRTRVAEMVRRHALAWALGRAEVEEIDTVNILQASLLAMRRAVLALDPAPEYVLVDGRDCPAVPCAVRNVVKGDALVPTIGAASILAKVARDEEMVELDAQYPGWGFASHKGYPTPAHLRVLRERGPTPLHRRSFGPVREALRRMQGHLAK